MAPIRSTGQPRSTSSTPPSSMTSRAIPHDPTSPPELMNSATAQVFLTGNVSSANTLDLWALTGTNVLATGGVPVLSQAVVNSNSYTTPPFSVQKAVDNIAFPQALPL